MKAITHWIGGKPWSGTAARTGDVHDPATGEVTGRVDFAERSEVDEAVAAARAAYPEWRDASLARRSSVLFAFRELLSARKDDLAEVITAEHGKVLDDAGGEVQRALEAVEFACGAPALLKGGFSGSASSGVDVHSAPHPLGVVGVISPFNFPAMVPLWFIPNALACGNAVVLKPSEKDPSAAQFLAELFAEAGLPAGVLTVLHGDKVAVDGLLEHPDVAAISFVGSTPVARYVYETGTRAGKRVQALGGAKNHMVVLPDADLDVAADAAVSAGFGSAGERCMAVSAVVAVGPVGDDLVARIAERVARLRVGDGRRGCDMGPLVTAAHRDKVLSYVEADEGAVLAVDGRGHAVDGAEGGFWLGPTLFDHVRPDMRLYRDEIFGPVLSVLRVDTYDEAVALVNANPYGNGAALFTASGAAARRFEADVEVGMVGINVPIPVPVGYYSFGGWKDSLFGDTHAYGPDGLHFFTRPKVVTTRWPTRSTVDLGFPRNT
ncbi:CoA-acylating methylmalonate-semialdehyde dehydrogenase [Actinokineospora bangkokensis]|uniref:methylmalonate-semialdehyde dehydrogenase (CoA acylating) n=1 Tax=Actinokineospora bangkokensis TaxID=1193682 RepID=A0A1Q9LSL7_9PSEU|nr:CoA-acylating methylmalonate-semialdehyde dehydrogenase [Actinokineospora bangkokensis]OLR95003.1 methylmalonate-semialdehyde dehydrogenase (acylating) [Actinokineospora bangkokensis]